MEQTIEQKVIALIQDKAGINIEDVKLHSLLGDDLGFDSLDAVELLMTIEQEFEIKIDDNDAEKFKKVEDIVNYLNERKK